MNRAQQLIKWFKDNGSYNMPLWKIDVPFFHEEDYLENSYEIAGQDRWSTYKSAVWKFDDESYAQITWEEGSTEYQDPEPHINIEEVEPYEETVVKYRTIL